MASLKKIDWPKVEKLCSIHCTGEEIAAILDIDYDTLNTAIKRVHKVSFSDYYKKHSSSGRASLRRMQFKAAETGNPTMLIWLGKQYLGQRDRAEDDTGEVNWKAIGQLAAQITGKMDTTDSDT